MRMIIFTVTGSLIILGAALLGVFKFIEHIVQTLPANNPRAFMLQGGRKGNKVLVCVGDSITHGTVSASYADMLAARLTHRNIAVVNAGINSELAYNALQHLDEIVACDPDYVTVLIGTNDAEGALSAKTARDLVAEMKLPRAPTLAWFRANLMSLCNGLRGRTHAKIALLSLPPLGETPDDRNFAMAAIYSRAIEETAAAQHLAYLPLNETMTAYLKSHGAKPRYPYRDDQTLMYKAIAKHFILGQSFDEISRGNGFLLLLDAQHLNSAGAAMVADLIEDFIRTNE